MSVAQNIEHWRRRRALTQEELSRAAGLSQNTIWRIESEGREPRPGTLRKIAEALKVPVEELTAPSDPRAATAHAMARDGSPESGASG